MNLKKNAIDTSLPVVNQDAKAKLINAGFHYMDTHVPKKTSHINLLKIQLCFISPKLWALQLITILILSLTVLASWMSSSITELIFRLMPLVGFLSVPEILKSYTYNMQELETVCKNRSGDVLLSRLVIVGFINVLTITIMSYILSTAMQQSLLTVLVQSFVPYNILLLIGLCAFKLFQDQGAKGCFMASGVSVVVLSFVADRPWFRNISLLTWAIILFITILALTSMFATEIKKAGVASRKSVFYASLH